MSDSESISRRTMLVITGAAGVTALAGCGGPGEEDDAEPENDEPEAEEPEEEEPEDEEAEDEEPEEDEAWADVEEFYFEGVVEEWTGIEPAIIEGESNPEITLIEGQEYDFRWVNGDGVVHNLEIRDEDGSIVDDYQSDDVGDEGEETTLEGVVATEEMTTYICTYHEATQVGDIVVESE